MSILHSIVNGALMKVRQFYDPEKPKDYPAQRQGEIAGVKMLRLPKGVKVTHSDLGGVPAEWIGGKCDPTDRIVLYIHGGGFVTGSSEARRGFTAYIADKLRLNVVSIDYRLAPEHPFPAGPEDCLNAYKALLERYRADRIVLLGESAGGNLVLSLLMNIKKNGLPYPAGVFALDPTVQYDRVLDSYTDNLPTDSIVTNLSDEVLDVYLCSRDEAVMKDPAAAPYYGDYTGCPPIVLWVSGSEVLRDDSLILFEKLKTQNVPAKLYIREGMMHTWMILPFLPESKKDLAVIGEDMRRALNGKLRPAGETVQRK